jgi:hypothetical protein
VRSSDGAAIRLLQDLIHREGNPKRVELFYDPASPGITKGAQFLEMILERVEVGKVERQEMDFVIAIKSAQLYARDHADSGALTRFARNTDTVDSIVICERQRCQAAAFRSLDYLVGWESSVRSGRVGMQVDERRPGRLCAHGS